MDDSFDWKIKEYDKTLVDKIAKEVGVSKTISKILVNRNLTTPEAVKNFFEINQNQLHNPYMLKDMDKAVERIVKAIQKKQKICIYGDYDVDGAVATSILMLFFNEIGASVDFYIPHRQLEGYSLNNQAIDKIVQQGVDLLITVDNGIMAHNEVSHANKLGLDVIVTDHHQVGETLPAAIAVINPQRKDCDYPFKGICGAGVAFKLIMALRQKLRELDFFAQKEQPNLKNYLDLLAIATVCDMVPLVDENRYFVKEGLLQIQFSKKVGLRALLQVCNLEGEITTTDLGFRLGPRINACGRLEDAKVGVLMLTAQDESLALNYARLLNSLNQERRSIEIGIVEEVIQQIERDKDTKNKLGLVLYDPEWHVGVVGIVASRVVDKFKRPTFVLTKNDKGLIKGSGRSVGGVSLITALRDCQDYLEQFGGHEAAAGVTLTESQLKGFVQAFDEAIKKQMSFTDLKRVVLVDDKLTAKEIDERLLSELKKLEPHGMGNMRPLFASTDVKIHSKKVVGKDHLKLKIAAEGSDLDAIAFNKATKIDEVGDGTGMIYGLEINKFRNIERLQMVVRDFIDRTKK